ncbi:hypothetical protein CFC21_041005 [Triticum aestivum]|uniref:C2H2-type domain-containing protein n=3 Tax=Triticum TaxID=4564 RepID=A0A9R1JTL7_WHEAT|nr:uncharacterized protein LOC123069602 [Triticum aestivum]KAF7029200.1 hypothetical protein CFC21_041005 [Triticum aestivum]CDM82675.1 unnamed protein product [Triticum aestivum]VAH75813.1 unnamed protein product [Triticum turgidum subsp. durum]
MSSPLEFEELSQTCRRDSFCLDCFHAFCSHCCGSHHHRGPFHTAISVDVAGRPVFQPGDSQWMPDEVVRAIAAEDYDTPLPRDSYCTGCKKIFCAAACPHHSNGTCLAGVVLRIEEHGGAHCVRCTGFEPWFRRVEGYLGDPVGEEEDELLLLPVLRRAPGTCAQCHAHWAGWHYEQHCSLPCINAWRQEVLMRRERREARRAARDLANLQIHH